MSPHGNLPLAVVTSRLLYMAIARVHTTANLGNRFGRTRIYAMKTAIVIVLSALCLVGAGAQETLDKARLEAREKTNLRRWQGTFELTLMVEDGKVLPKVELGNRTLTVDGNKYHFQSGDFSEHGTYKWDVSKYPREVDITVGDGKDKGKVYKAIFDATDQRIMLAFEKANKNRPKVLVATTGSGLILETWTRVN